MKKKLQVEMKRLIKPMMVFLMFLGVNTIEVIAQDVEPIDTEAVEEEDKKKEKKESGKIEKSDKTTAAIKYRRSSLHTMIIEDAKLPKIDIILNTFNNAEFPDKYNDHTVGDKSFKLEQYYVGPPEPADGEKKDKKAEKDLSPSVTKYLVDNKVANKMMAKWFNRNDDGAFNMDLIGERGSYDASAQAAAVASTTERGTSMLADAGEELIPNTFVVVNYSKFVSNEPTARAARDIALELAKGIKMEELRKLAVDRANNAYNKAKEGYSVWTTAYLYQLQWTDSIQAVFYQDMWMDETNVDPAKKELFDNTNLFELKLLGFEKSSSLISGLGANAENEQMIIKNATVKSINSVYNKLQRKFEAFRTKTPLVSTDPLGAKIGMKEGVENGDKYEVLEQSMDENGKIIYKRKGVIKVEKNKIWDNRFNVGDGQEQPLDEEGNPIKPENDLEFTHFKGGKGYYPGMLLRQIN